MIAPNASDLKETISIITVKVPYDGNDLGTVVSTFATCKAQVIPLGGSVEATTQEERQYNQIYRIFTRWITGVTPFQQILWGTKRLIMTQPPEDLDNKHRWLLIHATEPVTAYITR